jgi:hypothetical protein
MDETVVRGLSARGLFAAEKLVSRFGPDGDGWTNHRWLRFRAATAALSEWLAGFEKGFSTPADPSYDDLLTGSADQPSYKIKSSKDLTAVRDRTATLREEIRRWLAEADALTGNRPNQPPVLRLVPRTSADIEVSDDDS